MGMKPLPPVGNKNDIAHCLKTRFDTDEQILGAKYEMQRTQKVNEKANTSSI